MAQKIVNKQCLNVYIPADKISDAVGDYSVSWAEMLESCHKDDYFAQLAVIYPRYSEEHGIQHRFHVAVVQSGEGAVPHVHVYYEDTDDGGPSVAYVSLHEATYAPQHRSNTKILTPNETNALVEFFNTFRDGAYISGEDGKITRCNCWRECVEIWISTYDLPKELFQYDGDGEFLMPNYSEIKQENLRAIFLEYL